MARIYAFLAAGVLIALLGGLWLWTLLARPDARLAECGVSQVAGGASQIGGPFTLIDAKGDTVTDKDVITKPSLVYFGYTYCPDVCPLDTSRNADAADLLAQRGIEVAPIFITVDPERDTPEVVGEFAANLHERMIGLTGSPEQIKAAAQAYKVYYKAHPAEDGYYLVDHSTFTYLVLPDAGFIDFFRRDVSAEEMADRVACIVERS